MAITINGTLSAEPFEYAGAYDPDEDVCVVRWKMADLLDAMNRQGVELTDENVKRVLDSGFARSLGERSTEEGWEIADCLIKTAF